METTREYSSNVVRTLNPKLSTIPSNNAWNDEQHYESKTTSRRNIIEPTDHQLASTNFIRQAQSNFSTRSNYSTKSSSNINNQRDYGIDDGLIETVTPIQQRQKITTTTTTTKNYSGGSGGGGGGGAGPTEYLDELLDDLKNERSHSNDLANIADYSTTTYNNKYNSTNAIPLAIPPAATTNYVNKRTEHYTTKSSSSGNLIDNHYPPHHIGGGGTTVKRTEHIEVIPSGSSSSIQRSKHVEVLNSKTLETVPASQHTSSETVVKRDIVSAPVIDPLKDIPLDGTVTEDLLPLPGTKVTTTVRTYTYEVPSVPTVITRSNVLYHDDLRTDPTLPPNPSHVTAVHKTSTLNKNYSENITNINDNYNTTTKTTDTRVVNGGYPVDGKHPPVEILPHVVEPGEPGYHPGQPGYPKQTYYYKREVHNTKNTISQPPPPQTYVNEYHVTNTTNTTNRYPPNNQLRPISPESGSSPIPPVHPHPSHPPVAHHTYITKTTTTNDYTDSTRPRNLSPYDGPRPPYDSSPRPASPGGPITQTYIRSSEKTTTSTMPFPLTDGQFPPVTSSPTDDGDVAQPPKKVHELMAEFDGPNANGETDEIRRKREIDTSIANTDNNTRVPSRNQAGPPVYYPPNSELTLRSKAEGGGAWRAQGGMAQAAAGSEYYAEQNSKSKSKSGAAVVPVCLPLCCAMPCVLM